MPGDVFTSRNEIRAVVAQDQVEPAPAAAADDVERARAHCARISRSFASGRPAGQKYFVSSEKYLLW